MSMHWVLSGNIFNEFAWEALLETLNRFDIPYSEHKVVPFVGELLPDPPADLNQGNCIVIGPYSMRHIAKAKGWYPGSFDIEEKDFTQQRAMWGQEMLNADSEVVRFDDARWPLGEERFIRPIHDSKCFAGRTIDMYEMESWQGNIRNLIHDNGSTITPDTPIQVCGLKKIFAEYRCWVVKGKIITISRYKLGWTVAYTNWDGPLGDPVREYAQRMVDRWQPHEAFVIDVCDTNEGFKIVEINTLNSCGFYACDMQKLIITLHEEFSK